MYPTPFIHISEKKSSRIKLNCLKIFSFLILFIILFSSCRKKDSNNDAKAPAQYAVYTMSFTEENGNKGIAVVILLQDGKKIMINNRIFRYFETDINKVEPIGSEFIQHIIIRDTSFTNYPTLGEYMNSYFVRQNNFNKSEELSNAQLYNLVNNNTFDLSLKPKVADGNLILALAKLLSSSAHAGSFDPSTAILSNYIAVMGGVLVGTAVTLLSPIEIPTLIMLSGTAAINSWIAYATGTSITSNTVYSGTGSPTIAGNIYGEFATVFFGGNQIGNTFNSSWINQILLALSGPDYSPPAQLPESAEDLWPSIETQINNIIIQLTVTNTLSVATGDAMNITSSGASINALNSSNGNYSNYFRGISYSTNPNPNYYNSKVFASNGLGNFSVNLVALTPNTTYYYRGFTGYNYGINNTQTIAQGEVKSFQTTNLTGSLALGDTAFGGIIFYLDGTGQHGLVYSLNDLGIFVEWDETCVLNNVYVPVSIGATDTAIGTGRSNTDKIIAAIGNGNNAASLCRNLHDGGFNDWFLPSRNEVAEMFLHNSGLYCAYWSSTEVIHSPTYSNAILVGCYLGPNYSEYFKYHPDNVRAVRAF